MSNRLLPIIIILMIGSVIGIISVQWFWIKQSIALEKLSLEKSVQRALKATVQSLEKDELAWYISPGQLSVFETRDFAFEILDSDTLMRREHKTLLNSNDQRIEEIVLIESDQDSIESDSSFTRITHHRVHQSGISKDSILVEISSKAQIFGEVVNQMIVEEISNQYDPIERLKKLNIDSILNYHMSFEGIESNYQYAVYRDRDSIPVLGLSSVHPALKTSDYQAKLFPSSFKKSDLSLSVSLPDALSIVLNQLGWRLAGAIAFSMLMILTFAIVLKYILKQKKMDRVKTDFINHMTHEFKTPLATMRLALDSIEIDKVRQDKTQFLSLTSVIRQETERLDDQAEYILRGGILNDGDEFILKPGVQLNDIIQSTLSHLKLQITELQAVVQLELDEELPLLSLDYKIMEFVIGNLIVNSLKYSKDIPRIKIKTEYLNQEVRIVYSDEGIGMSEETLRNAFKKFYRAKLPSRYSVEGFGLGLSFVKFAVERHGGQIEVKSNLGNGSEFIIRFQIND